MRAGCTSHYIDGYCRAPVRSLTGLGNFFYIRDESVPEDQRATHAHCAQRSRAADIMPGNKSAHNAP